MYTNETEAQYELLGNTAAMREVATLIRTVAPSRAAVLVQGETGTGKELVARALHRQSGRAGRPFVAVNCGALNSGVVESELFGHVSGAFTGAMRDRVGCFERAQGGTLFLDEIGDATKELQVKLLRGLQEGEIQRVGSSETKRVDVRVVAATHHDLAADVAAGTFRQDLYFRLNAVLIAVPPLRARLGDLDLLMERFLARHRTGDVELTLSEEARAALERHPFPGNVRELEMVAQSAAARLPRGGVIQPSDLALKLLPKPGSPSSLGREERWDDILAGMVDAEPNLTWDMIRAQVILAALRRHKGNKTAAAKELGMHRTTFAKHEAAALSGQASGATDDDAPAQEHA